MVSGGEGARNPTTAQAPLDHGDNKSKTNLFVIHQNKYI